MPSGRLCTIPRRPRGRTPRNDTTLIPAAANQPVRGALRVLVLLAVFGAMLAVASPAGAASSCGRAVIDDWYDNGRVDGTYALHCYDDAINTLPRDVRDYSSAKDDIQRALQARKRGEPAPPASTDPTPGDGSTTPEDPEDPSETSTYRYDRIGSDRGSGRPAERQRGGRRNRRRGRQRQLRSDPAPDPRRPRAPARRGRLRRLCGAPHPGSPPAAVDLELSRRPGGPGG